MTVALTHSRLPGDYKDADHSTAATQPLCDQRTTSVLSLISYICRDIYAMRYWGLKEGKNKMSPPPTLAPSTSQFIFISLSLCFMSPFDILDKTHLRVKTCGFNVTVFLHKMHFEATVALEWRGNNLLTELNETGTTSGINAHFRGNKTKYYQKRKRISPMIAITFGKQLQEIPKSSQF